MCGINGFTFNSHKKIEVMNRELSHRGPDYSGVYLDNNLSKNAKLKMGTMCTDAKDTDISSTKKGEMRAITKSKMTTEDVLKASYGAT